MTSRRGTLIEDGARELLQINGYAVRVIPPGFNKGFPPVHLVASQPSGETRFIRIRKISHIPSTTETIKTECTNDLVQLRKYIALYPGKAEFHYEIWIYSLSYGFRCFDVLMDSIREIPKPAFAKTSIYSNGGAA